jgi:hypothetical protein
MTPTGFNTSSPSDATNKQVPSNAESKIFADAFLELFELLEEYAPVWYTEQHCALAAKVVLTRILKGC